MITTATITEKPTLRINGDSIQGSIEILEAIWDVLQKDKSGTVRVSSAKAKDSAITLHMTLVEQNLDGYLVKM